MTSKKIITSIVVILILFLITIIIFFTKILAKNAKTTPPKITEQETTKPPISNYQRDDYHVILDKTSLLDAYLKNKIKIEFQNNQNISTSINFDNLFYTNNQVLNDLKINITDSDQQKVDKIYQFVKKLDFKIPLYWQADHNPTFIYSSYGFGDCGISANLICALANFHNIKCRIWHMSKHTVPEVFYNNSSHLYDPTGIGTITKNNQVADINYAISLAKDNQLIKFNQSYAQTEDHKLFSPPFLNNQDFTNQHIILKFFPHERKIFLNNLFFVNDFPQSQNPNRQYNQTLSTYIREIPLDQSMLNNELKINSFFPIIGVFIISDNNPKLKTDQLPTLQFLGNTQSIITQPISDYPFDDKNYIFDFSSKIEQFTNEPVKSVTIGNLNAFLKKVHQIKILTVHVYSKKYSNFSPNNLSDFKNINTNINVLDQK